MIFVLENRIRQLQNGDLHTKIDNVLYTSDLAMLYSSSYLCNRTTKGYQTRLVFTIENLTGMRPTALWYLSVDQVSKVKIRDGVVWKISGRVGPTDGTAKQVRVAGIQLDRRLRRYEFRMRTTLGEK